MMHFVVICKDSAGSPERRRTALDDHRRYVDTHAASIIASGPLVDDDSDARLGQVFMLEVADRAAAESFVADDPFMRVGVFSDVEITRFEPKFQSRLRI
jgi:hypothetical protein